MPKRVFLDANIWFAAACSPSGGSAVVLEYAKQGLLIACANQHVLDEALRNLLLKAPNCVDRHLGLLAGLVPVMTDGTISVAMHKELSLLVPLKDIPVLAGSILGKVDYLATLDRRDLMNPQVRAHAWSFKIVTPGELLTLLRGELGK